MPKLMLDISHVSMKFNLSKEKIDSLKEYFVKFLRREIHYNEFYALTDVTFRVFKGDRLGILGMNGAGKSTLLKVIAGVFKPTSGKVEKHGN
ncbi:MAG: ATP-binding cassette domain-containing protein, partial [Oscillospiraceae bacterium]